MGIIVKHSVVHAAVLLCLLNLISCSENRSEPSRTIAQWNEESNQPSIRLSGTYSCVRLELDNGYVEGRGQVKGQGFMAELTAKGDSVQIIVSGQGTTGRYNRLDLGTYAIVYHPAGSTNGGYFTLKKDILNDYNAIAVVNRTIGGTSSRQITYSFPISIYQYLAGTPQAGQLTLMKAPNIFTSTQRVVGIFTFERSIIVVH